MVTEATATATTVMAVETVTVAEIVMVVEAALEDTENQSKLIILYNMIHITCLSKNK